MQDSSYNPFTVAQSQFDQVATMLDLDKGVCELLRQPMRQFIFTIPVRMDDGSYQSLIKHSSAGFRVGDRVRFEGGELQRY